MLLLATKPKIIIKKETKYETGAKFQAVDFVLRLNGVLSRSIFDEVVFQNSKILFEVFVFI